MLTYLPTVCYIYPVIYESLEYRQLETAQYVLFWTDDVTVSADERQLIYDVIWNTRGSYQQLSDLCQIRNEFLMEFAQKPICLSVASYWFRANHKKTSALI